MNDYRNNSGLVLLPILSQYQESNRVVAYYLADHKTPIQLAREHISLNL